MNVIESTWMRDQTEELTNQLTFLSKKNAGTGPEQPNNIKNDNDQILIHADSVTGTERQTYHEGDDFTRKQELPDFIEQRRRIIDQLNASG